MRRSMFAVTAVALAAAFSLPSALQAHDSGSSRNEGGSMMGQGMMNGMGQMNQMMDHCSQMMQGRSAKPNEQWRDEAPPAGSQSGKKQ